MEKARLVGDGEKREDTEGWGEEGMFLGKLCLHTGIASFNQSEPLPRSG